MTQQTLLIAGGAGYIGSHMVDDALAHGFEVVVLDNLSNGHRDAVPDSVPFYEGDIADADLLAEIFQQHAIDAVMHFAAFIEVGESVTHPAKYFDNNTVKTIALLDTMRSHGVNKLIFSSTAAVYGMQNIDSINESVPCQPINPYGVSKYCVEQVLQSYATAYDFKYVALRYFNASGAHPAGHLAERHHPETHLIPLLLEVAAGQRDTFFIYGDDYPTPDGTCLRDFVHVMDLASAHRAALSYLVAGGASTAFNIGYNQGYSVREIITMVERVTGCKLSIEVAQRRPGDPAVLIADSTKLQQQCGWTPQYNSVGTIIEHAWQAKQNRLL